MRDDEIKSTEYERAIPLNKEDKRYTDAPTYFTLHDQVGQLKPNKNNSCWIIPTTDIGGFQEILLPIRLLSKEAILQIIDRPGIYDNLSDVSIVFSGDVKRKELLSDCFNRDQNIQDG